MAKKELTPKEIKELAASPYVASVNSSKISFTAEFKRVMYEELIHGKTIRTILKEHGINPEILGNRRLWGIAQNLRAKADHDEGFADLRQHNSRKPAKQNDKQNLEDRIKQLEHELAYTRQEVEFLKKIHMADLEARKQWESKHRQK